MNKNKEKNVPPTRHGFKPQQFKSSALRLHYVFAFFFFCFSTDIQIVHAPWGSTSLAIFKASELARSELAGDTASIRQFSLVTNCISMSRIWASMSAGWSPTGTLVIPGRSTRVRLSTEGGRWRRKSGFAFPDRRQGSLHWVVSLRLTVRGVNTQVDGHWGDSLVGACDAVSFRLDLLTNFVKVCKLFTLAVEELGMFWEEETARD